jgi:Phosphotransferase enzyme family
VPGIFATEPAITAGLYRLHPDLVPEVLDIDVERGWLLTRDFGEKLLVSEPPDAWLRALEGYADLQLAWLGRASELHALGCPDRTVARLEHDVDRVLGDVDALLPGRPEGLSDDELARLPEVRAKLHDAARGVAAFGLPPTLDHGDLHAGNIVVRDGKPLIFDWSDACLALPLVSVTPMLAWDESAVTFRGTLRDAYLERIGAPRAAYDDAMLLGLAHQAVSYHRITEGTAPHSRWEWDDVLPWIVKQLLARLPR